MSSPSIATAAFEHTDILLVGGGLQGALLALALAEHRPTARFVLVEAENQVGGNHTWCFHAHDIPPTASFASKLGVFRWPNYDVRFPGFQRTLNAEYAGTTSRHLADAVESALSAMPSARLITGVAATSIDNHEVALADGRQLHADTVIDARGPTRDAHTNCGYQKFVGFELVIDPRSDAPRAPTVMDACVPQIDGFRFFYTLPFARDRILIEDTYFSDTPDLDHGAIGEEVLAYARRHGMRVVDIVRHESGVLPMPWAHPGPNIGDGPFVLGYRGGWFHPGTGYSLPVAARLAEIVARAPDRSARAASLAHYAAAHRRQARYALMLNSLLFRWGLPAQRWRMFARFYRLPEPLISRFYALELTRSDRIRILAGRPPEGLSLKRRFGRGTSNA